MSPGLFTYAHLLMLCFLLFILFFFFFDRKEKNCIKKELCYMITTKKCSQTEKTDCKSNKKASYVMCLYSFHCFNRKPANLKILSHSTWGLDCFVLEQSATMLQPNQPFYWEVIIKNNIGKWSLTTLLRYKRGWTILMNNGDYSYLVLGMVVLKASDFHTSKGI